MDIPYGVTLDTPKFLIIAILVEINTSPATKQRQSTIYRAQTTEVPKLLLGLLLCPTKHGTQQRQELDTLRIPTKLALSHLADLSDVLRHDDGTVAADEDGLRVLRGEGLAGLGGSGLQDDGGALGTGLAEVRAGNVEVFADMIDFADAGGFGVDVALAVEDDGVGAPGGFPKFVGDFDVFLGDSVAVVVLFTSISIRVITQCVGVLHVADEHSPCFGLPSRDSQ